MFARIRDTAAGAKEIFDARRTVRGGMLGLAAVAAAWLLMPATARAASAGAGSRPATTAPASSAPAAAPARPTDKQLADARAVFQRLLKPPELTPQARSRIDKLIADLGANEFRVRERATAELLAMGEVVAPFAGRATRSTDPEVVVRARLILDTLQARDADLGAELDPAIEALAAAGDKSVVAMLVQLLDHSSLMARSVAEYGLRRLTGQSFGYSAFAEPDRRDQAAAKWRDWWKRSEAGFTFDRARAAQAPAGLLITDDATFTLTLVTLGGEVVWNRKFGRRVHCAAALPNGHYIVGFSDSSGPETNLAEFDLRDEVVWTERRLNLGQGMVYDVRPLPNGNLLIAYVGDNHVSEVTPGGKMVWQMKEGLASPGAAERLANGNTLITANHGSKVIEVTPQGKTVWQKAGLNNPCDATQMPNGNVLISEWGTHKILLVDRGGKTVWERQCTDCCSAVQWLPDGTIVINDRAEGTILLDAAGKKIRTIFEHKSGAKVRFAPAGFVAMRRKAGREKD